MHPIETCESFDHSENTNLQLEHPAGSGVKYVWRERFGSLKNSYSDDPAVRAAFATSRRNRSTYIAAEVDAGLAYIPSDRSHAGNDPMYDASPLAYFQLAKLMHTRFELLGRVTMQPITSDKIDRPAYRFEPVHEKLPLFQSVARRVYHEEIPKPEFLELITQALPLNENFEEIRTMFAPRWQGHPILRTMLEQ